MIGVYSAFIGVRCQLFADCIACHTLDGVSGMSICPMPSGLSASITALATAGIDPVQPDSPTPFTPERAHLARRRMLVALDAAQQPRARHEVVHEAAGQELAGLAVVDWMCSPSTWPDALHDAAVDLAFDDGVVDHHAAVVHRAVGGDLRRAGRGIDLDFDDVAAVRDRSSRTCLRP